MNENDYIKKLFPFKKPLNSRRGKDYVEYLSLEILKFCYNDIFSDFVIEDAPDIQNKEKTVGIEVTEAISEKEAQIEGEFVKYRTKDDEETRKRSKAIIEANGGELEEYVLSYPTINSQIEKEVFQDALAKKMKKLAFYRGKGFGKMGLFIYYREIPIPFKLADIKAYFDEVLKDYSDKYDWLFFSFPCSIIRYDINSEDIQTIIIGQEEYNNMKYKARVFVEEKQQLEKSKF